MCDQGCIWAYLACRTPPILTSTTKAKRETPLQPWPPLMWKWKLNKQQHQHRYNKKKRTTTGLIFFVYLFISWPTARRPLLSKQKQKRKRVEFHTNRSQGWNATLQLSFHASVTALRLTATRGDRWAGVGQSVFFFFFSFLNCESSIQRKGIPEVPAPRAAEKIIISGIHSLNIPPLGVFEDNFFNDFCSSFFECAQ